MARGLWLRPMLCAVGVLLLSEACGSEAAKVVVTPRNSASDQPLSIVADHLPRSTTVSVTVTSTDAAHVTWSNVVKLRTDETGNVIGPPTRPAPSVPGHD